MQNLENKIQVITPIFIKGLILVGITVCLLSITLAIYSFLKKKQTLKEIGSYMLYTFGGGTIVSLFGLLVNFTANFNIDFISYRYTIPLAYIISLITFLSLIHIANNKQ